MESFDVIGERLREERKRLGKSQEELSAVAAAAGAVGATRQSQALYEKGQRYPDVAYMAAVAGVGVDVRYVVTGQRGQALTPALSNDEQRVLALFKLASPAVRRAAVGVLATGEMPAAAPPAPGRRTSPSEKTTTVIFHGQVGQHIKGDVTAPQAIHMVDGTGAAAPAGKRVGKARVAR